MRKQKRTNIIYQVITHTKTKRVTGSTYYLNYLYYNRAVTGTTFIWKNLSRKIGPAKLNYEFYQAHPTWSYYYDGKQHRVDGPSCFINKTETWNRHGKTHRLNGPAVTHLSYETGNLQVKFWKNDDKVNRKDGPAIIRYYENGNVMVETWYGDHEQKTLIKCYDPEGNLDVERKYDNKNKWLGDTGKSLIQYWEDCKPISRNGKIFTNGEWTLVRISFNKSMWYLESKDTEKEYNKIHTIGKKRKHCKT